MNRKPLIYLVDDDDDLVQILKVRLNKMGIEYLAFKSPEEFYKAYFKKIPDLLLVDLHLEEGVSGFDIIERLRGELKAVFPILILSADEEYKSIANGLELGANDYIVKPLSKEIFQSTLSRYINFDNQTMPVESTLKSVLINKRKASLSFDLNIEEVRPDGFILCSTHLIKKGSSIVLTGPEIKQISPSSEKLLCKVVGTAIKPRSIQKVFQIHVEIDITQDTALKEIEDFLAAKFSQRNIGIE